MLVFELLLLFFHGASGKQLSCFKCEKCSDNADTYGSVVCLPGVDYCIIEFHYNSSHQWENRGCHRPPSASTSFSLFSSWALPPPSCFQPLKLDASGFRCACKRDYCNTPITLDFVYRREAVRSVGGEGGATTNRSEGGAADRNSFLESESVASRANSLAGKGGSPAITSKGGIKMDGIWKQGVKASNSSKAFKRAGSRGRKCWSCFPPCNGDFNTFFWEVCEAGMKYCYANQTISWSRSSPHPVVQHVRHCAPQSRAYDLPVRCNSLGFRDRLNNAECVCEFDLCNTRDVFGVDFRMAHAYNNKEEPAAGKKK